MGRHFTTRPATEAGRKLAEAIEQHGLAEIAHQLGIDRYRLLHIVSGGREARVSEVFAVARSGIATLIDWVTPVSQS